MRTLGDYLDVAGGRPAGFDYMRLILAFLVVIGHAYNVAEGEIANRILWITFPIGAVKSAILPMFFALSGFLVAGSMIRCRTLVKFMGLRFIRIYPALAVEVLLTALLLGPFVTQLSIGEYFTDPGFFRYLVNVTGHVTIFLPEVFSANPRPDIANEQLWTVPFELYCYIVLGILIFIGAKRSNKILLAGTAVFFGLVLLRIGIVNDWVFPDWDGPVSGYMLVVSFLVGVCLYVFRNRIPTSPALILVVSAVTLATFTWAPQDRILGCFPAAYLTVMLGVLNPRRNWLVNGADYSYGMYLYHYVILQTVIHVAGGELSWYWTLIFSMPFIVAFSALSWHVVEKPALMQKLRLDTLEGWHIRRLEQRSDEVSEGGQVRSSNSL
ncbi:acyltransferase family protein [Sagittula sp. SSi028]|uniref:acyltransferase family protein n=1 Tax=Sagittula sp. SSi028 TaxID=3400636 RepID=UPI003AF694F6